MIHRILIKQVELNQQKVDILIERNLISRIGKDLVAEDAEVIDATGMAVIPGLVNGHTHAAMTLFRGFADDMKLMPWLEQKIWPNEAKMTREDVYWGAKLACLEMIKSGTTTFLDMYQKFRGTADAVEEMGIRGYLSAVCFDHFDPKLAEKSKKECEKLYDVVDEYGPRVQYAVGPHAIYTVSGELLQWIHTFANEHQALIHLHLAETEEEVNNSIRQFGFSPVRYLYKLGVLSPRLVIAHGVYVDKDEIRMLADYGVKVIHNPASNMKLASGISFKFAEMKQAGVKVGMEAATCTGADILGLKAGRIEEGYLADLCLIDLQSPAFTPNFNFVSNLVYAANGSCVDTVICNGKVVMRHKQVPGEAEILEQAARCAYNLVKR